MFKIGETVIYGTDGICTVADIAEKNFNSVTEQYYILKPLYSKSSTIMVPVANQALVAKMRYMLSSEEVKDIIDRMPDMNCVEWIEDDKQRRTEYKGIISRCDGRELAGLIKTLYIRSEEQKKKGKKLHATDERFFRDAERMLYDEFAVVLEIERESVLPYIQSHLTNRELDA